ncbi:MAG: LysR family transcriptional regulator [Gammaproteobacteria bacterium]|nr:MAG: LysR family transcriptional regulator [Gammaproteobacteria bacterium]UTW41892.1 LysR family transcriptional regulator [bacterium SCSIO 12844]
MNIKDLKILKTIIDEMSISKAADKVHLTQPAVSNIVKKLRYELNDELFIRSGNQLLITSKAREIYSKLEVIVENYHSILEKDKLFDPYNEDFKFKIAFSNPFADFISKAMFDEITKNNYKVKIELSMLPIINNFDRNDHYYDYIFATNSAPEDYIQRPVSKHKLVVAHKGALDHVKEGQSITLEEYCQLKHIAYYTEKYPSYLTQIMGGESRNIAFAVNSPTTAMQLLDEHHVINICESYAKYLNLKYVDIPLNIPELTLNYYIPSWTRNSAPHKWLHNFINQIITETVPWLKAGNDNTNVLCN